MDEEIVELTYRRPQRKRKLKPIKSKKWWHKFAECCKRLENPYFLPPLIGAVLFVFFLVRAIYLIVIAIMNH